MPIYTNYIIVNISGAAGATSGIYLGGRGANVIATLTVIPGELLYIYVGGMGTISNGGINGGGNGFGFGGGGGASDIRRVAAQTTAGFNSRIIVAGGGINTISIY